MCPGGIRRPGVFFTHTLGGSLDKKIESVTVRFDEPTLEALKARSLVEDRSPSDLVRRAVAMYLYGVMGSSCPSQNQGV